MDQCSPVAAQSRAVIPIWSFESTSAGFSDRALRTAFSSPFLAAATNPSGVRATCPDAGAGIGTKRRSRYRAMRIRNLISSNHSVSGSATTGVSANPSLDSTVKGNDGFRLRLSKGRMD